MFRKITINIKNFGPIREETTISLAPFMLFTGVSGLGKSYLAMLVHYVYRILCGGELDVFFKTKNIDFEALRAQSNGEEIVACEVYNNELTEWIDKRALLFMQDMLGNPKFKAEIHIGLPDLPEKLTFYYCSKKLGINAAVKTNAPEENTEMEFIRLDNATLYLPPGLGSDFGSYVVFLACKNFFRRHYGIENNNTFFMPPSRGSLVAVPDELIARMRDTMGMYTVFLNNLSTLKGYKFQMEPTETSEKASNYLCNEVLHGDIQLKDGDIIYHVDDDDLPITAAASSIKELAPFALMIQKKLLGDYSVLFEEPESHLHPEMQVKVADLLSYALQEGTHLQVTTHSDYFLRRINDLIRLHQLRLQLNDEEKFQNFCQRYHYDSGLALSSHDVNAYYLSADEQGNVHVKLQDTSHGIPFDTFDKVLDAQMASSSALYEAVEYGWDE